jgi:hypothetical protein
MSDEASRTARCKTRRIVAKAKPTAKGPESACPGVRKQCLFDEFAGLVIQPQPKLQSDFHPAQG